MLLIYEGILTVTLIAVDTNIMIRLAMRDDEIQYQKVMNLLIANQFFISTTVQIEIEWVTL
jgi:predicted nucleic-acid-binding protein